MISAVDRARVTPTWTMPDAGRAPNLALMRLPSAVVASSSVALVVLVGACTGSDPVCDAPACTAQTNVPAGPVALELVTDPQVTVFAGTTVEITIGTKNGKVEPGAAAPKLTITASDLPPNVTSEPLVYSEATNKLRITALPSAKHVATRIRLKLTDADGRYSGETALVLAVRDKAGVLDNSFGENGTTEIPGGVGGTALAGIATSADAIFVGGGSEKNFVASRIAIADGKIDTAYGTNGIAVGNLRAEVNSDEIAEGLAIGPKGQAYVAGYGISGVPESEYQVGRFDAKGVVDKAFNGTGFFAGKYTGGSVAPEKIVELSLRGVAVQPKDGKIVFGGVATENLLYPIFTDHAVVARLGEDGKLDNSFGGGDGWSDRITTSTQTESCKAVMIGALDNIYCAGSTQAPTGAPPKTFFVWRLTPAGGTDPSYGSDGVAKIAYAPNAVQGEIQTIHPFETKAIVVGISNGKAVVMRLDPTSGLGDPTFNGGAPVVLDGIGPLDDLAVLRSAVDKDGAVSVVTTSGVNNDIVLARVLPGGRIDTQLGPAGVATMKLASKGLNGRARIAIQADGRIVVGTSVEGKGLVLYRLWGT